MLETVQQPRTCSHEKREYIGTEWPAEFYRCTSCGAIVVVQGGKTWLVRQSNVRA